MQDKLEKLFKEINIEDNLLSSYQKYFNQEIKYNYFSLIPKNILPIISLSGYEVLLNIFSNSSLL